MTDDPERRAWFEREIATLESRRREIASPRNFADQVSGAAAAHIDSMVVDANKYFDDLDSTAASEAERRARDAIKNREAGIKGIGDASAAARAELDALNAKAAEGAAAVVAAAGGGEAPGGGGGAAGGAGGLAKIGLGVSTSAAAAIAAGFGGSGGRNPVVEELKLTRREIQAQKRLAHKFGADMAAALMEIGRVSRGLTHG